MSHTNGKHAAQTIDAIERAAEDALAEIAALRLVCEQRQSVIDTLQRACADRLALIERLSAEVEALRKTAETFASDGVDWRAVAIERGAALESVSVEAERRAVLLADLTAALRDRTEEVETLRRGRVSSL